MRTKQNMNEEQRNKQIEENNFGGLNVELRSENQSRCLIEIFLSKSGMVKTN